jgi:hypothetical protein
MKRKSDLLAEIRRACLRETRGTVAENLKLNAVLLPNHVYRLANGVLCWLPIWQSCACFGPAIIDGARQECACRFASIFNTLGRGTYLHSRPSRSSSSALLMISRQCAS